MTTKYIELHLIQNFAPSCLNRDDTNTPKDCEFGGVRRARISSQCLKRAIRNQFKKYFEEKDIGKRTRQVKYLIKDKLIEKGKEEGVDIVSEHCGSRLRNLLVGGEKTVIHIGIDETDKIVDVILNNWDEVLKHAEKKKKLPDKIEKEFVSICEEHSKNIDIALFGRMMASKPKANQDASCQVAHAISTHAVSLEWDFYTAVDELSREEETGAGMMGVIGYDSACFYRYSLLDIEQLFDNLDGDKE
ncbi:MAG TPA: type I-E CRISPR-associated protein Cas7/Cse4/CasC, partial [Firmicutes bacterium]|nr:type I-E CRISPR-associated protein Cas7/Cse4/CasC [Bacillota bacterium]